MKLKRLFAALAIFSLSGIGITYAAGEDTNAVQNFFLGGTDLGDPNLNQMLAVLVGPQGETGPAGVAGADGFVGMNGQDGKDGLPGAPGEVGPQGAPGAPGAPGAQGAPGAAVVAVVLAANADANCPQGGTKFTSAAGVVSYACNGSGSGGGGGNVVAEVLPVGDANCVNGGTKFTDAALTVTYACNGSVTSGNLGLGNVALAACDANVNIAVESEFDGSSFSIAAIKLSNVSNDCANNKLVTYIPIKTSGAKKGSSTKYSVKSPADVIVCSITSLAVSGNVVTVSDSTATCKVKGTTTVITLAEVDAEDMGTNIGLTLSN